MNELSVKSSVNLARRRETIGLGFLFGTMYFVQGIGEPTEGLTAQPVRSLLGRWGYDVGEIAFFAAILALPWSLKPIYGLFSDFLPLAGYRQKSYLIVTSIAALLGFSILYLTPLPEGSINLLLLLLLVPTFSVAFSDVVVDAHMIEKGQPLKITGRLQSIQWAAMYTAMVLTGVVGGYLSQTNQQEMGFLLCAAVMIPTVLLSIFFMTEKKRKVSDQTLRGAVRDLLSLFRNTTLLGVGGFMFLWNFNPFSTAVLQSHMIRELKLSEQFYGNTVSLSAIASVIACVCYGFYCRRIPFRWLVHASVVMGILSTLGYWALSGWVSAVLITVFVGFTYMTAGLIQLDLAARVCPPRTAATVFAALMALTNFSLSFSTGIGGYLYDWWSKMWGSDYAFQLLVAVGALATASCWLLVPFLNRHRDVTGEPI